MREFWSSVFQTYHINYKASKVLQESVVQIIPYSSKGKTNVYHVGRTDATPPNGGKWELTYWT